MSRSALVLCLLAAVCGAAHPSRLRGLTPDDDGRIVGGQIVEIWDFPWQVSLERYLGSEVWHLCGGSIISSTWVLTAASCLERRTPEELYVRAGSSFRESGGCVYNVTRLIKHEDYDNVTFDYDFGLIEITEQISFDSNVQAVNLGSSEIVGGTEGNVTGWGRVSAQGGKPWQLRAVTTSTVDRDTCEAAYAALKQSVTERMVCAGAMDGSKGFCTQDSGGPLVVGNTQYGVASWGKEGCAEPGYPGVYSYVPAVRAWITEKTGV